MFPIHRHVFPTLSEGELIFAAIMDGKSWIKKGVSKLFFPEYDVLHF